MEISGKIIAIVGDKTGVTKNGLQWRSRAYVIEEVNVEYPNRLLFEVFSDESIEKFNIQLNELVEIKFNSKASQWNGKWFNAIQAWSVRKLQSNTQPSENKATTAPSVSQQPQQAPLPTSEKEQKSNSESDKPVSVDDLPF